MYKLFLDDVRDPKECTGYMRMRGMSNADIYNETWVVVRNYAEFTAHINKNGLPFFVSIDHDLSDEHYAPDMNDEARYNKRYELFEEKTGLHCAKWLKDYCREHGLKLPKWVVHSMNPVGRNNIEIELQNGN